ARQPSPRPSSQLASRRRSQPFPDLPPLSEDEGGPRPSASRERSSSPAPPPPPSSSQPSTTSQLHSRTAARPRAANPQVSDAADVISIPSDSDSDSDDPWGSVRLPLYTQRKAAESDRSLSLPHAAEDEDEDEPMADLNWDDITLEYLQTGRRLASAGVASGSKHASASAVGRRSYRTTGIPSSSQESALDDEDAFFRGVSIVKNLT
ncbi:hypothetical protein C8Q80DRAFT_1264124, partial [Daedaleopsis nitida]